MKVVKLSAQCTSHLYLREIFLVPIYIRSWVDPSVIVRPEGICKWKIPMTPPGIEPATFQLVAQCLNQMRLHVLEKHPFFFLAHIYLINVANFPQFYNETLTVVIATARRYSTQQAACWYRLLTAYQGTGCDPSICFAVTSWVLPPKEHKINKRTCRFENKNWNAKSFT